MDEVDIDNVEDLNELEARLYAQIHHEATDESNVQRDLPPQGGQNKETENYNKDSSGGNMKNYETSSNTNRALSKRYWANGEHDDKQQKHQQNTNHRFIRNPFKPQNQQQTKEIEATTSVSTPNNNNNKTVSDEQEATNASANANILTTTESIQLDEQANKNNKNKNPTKMDQPNSQQKQPTAPTTEKSNLKLNPVADWVKRNKNQITKKSNTQNPNTKTSKPTTANLKQQQHGPFAKQQQKLQKVKRLEEKKQKSKKAKISAATVAAKKLKPTEIIDLDTDNDSDSSDVVMIPVPAPPTFTVVDSDEDIEDSEESIALMESTILEHEENALDSTDVQMSTTSSSFIKPQTISQQSLTTTANSGEKHLDNSSRCTSPCSIQSSDDFIGHTDRSRLLAGASGMADDEDLLVLTTDMNSLLEAPQTPAKHNEDVIDNLNSSEDRVENLDDSSKFVMPKQTKNPAQKDYRVDQSQFKALDVYESESDITDSVYTKGATKTTTVIRQIDTSSDGDDVEDITICAQRTKRLRKRRASSSNKESESGGNIENSSTDNEDDDAALDDNEVLRTAIPLIFRGPAVERCKPRKRTRTLSSCSPINQTRKVAKTSKPTTAVHMSDGEFIATLNNLAQGQDGEELEEEDDSEAEKAPTARDIAEKILSQHVQKTMEETLESDMAIPDEIYQELDKVFESIDNLDELEKQKNSPDEAVNISDSSDSNTDKNLTYKSLPNEDSHIMSYIEDTSSKNRTPEKKRSENGSPIYNVIYSRDQRAAGGIGWNDEMRKFYNESWKGEYFVLKRVLQKMSPEKTLWKIFSEDRFNIKSNRRHNNMKCTNCCEFGHLRSKCKRPKKPAICYMCGDSGHHEPRCPNTICLRCGNKTHVFTKSCNACAFQNRLICPICKIRGHSVDFCPDKWRRYHSTTEPNAYPNSSIDYNPKKFCCICGARGHLSDTCRSAVRFMEYPVIVSAVKSHQKSYSDLPAKTPHGGIGYNLMYEPCQEVKFDLVDRTTNNKYYGRFLNAVGLEYLLKRKRRLNSVTTDNTANKSKRLSKKYVANPYSKVGCANQKDTETGENAPNQVQEISESGNIDEPHAENKEIDIISLDDNSVDIELVGTTIEDDNDITNIQLNTINENTARPKRLPENFKSPIDVTSSQAIPTKSTTEPALILDSDSSYSFSEHYDVPSTSAAAAMKTNSNESQNISVTEKECNIPSIEEVSHIPTTEEESYIPLTQKPNVSTNSRPKPREMEALPDFIPLIDSTDDLNEDADNDGPVCGISRKFVAVESDDDTDENVEQPRRCISPLPELPCEAKIYLTHFHSKYLLSPEGNNFLVKTSKACKLKARLDFTSVGHVLVIFGLPNEQNKFQRELLLKYRELTDQCNKKQLQATHNVPKRADVLIRFLRDNITQLLNNLGNVNQLLKRLKQLERQQSKSCFKLAEKVRRSLNMILVGQAGLQDGSMHLDKLLLSLKTLMNDFGREDVAPKQLRMEITDHWKVIFTPYRHENYQKLVETYNKLISKNRVPKLAIDPLLLGQKILDTSFTAEQKQKLEQQKMLKDNTEQGRKPKTLKVNTEQAKQVLNQLNPKNSKRKQNDGGTESPPPPAPSSKLNSSTSRSNSPTKLPTPPPPPPKISLDSCNTSTPNKSKSSCTTSTSKVASAPKITNTSKANKIKSSSTASTPKAPPAVTTATKKQQQQKIMPPPPFANPEKRSTVSTSIQQVSGKWKSSCETLLTEISAEPPKNLNSTGGNKRDSKLPSTFWSRESLRYLDECMRLASARSEIVEKLERVQNKSKNGQLSYNDYLAVIKLHTALCGK